MAGVLVASQVGSGTIPFTYGILSSGQRGNEPLGGGIRTGNQVMIGNPEDMVAVDAFAASGIVIGTNPVEILGPQNNPLPRSRMVLIENTGTVDAYISHRLNFTTLDAFELSPEGTAGRDSRIQLPLLRNVSVYAKTASGSTTIRLLIV